MSNRNALVVGIDDYLSQPLRNCVNDASEFGTMLEMPEYGFNVKKIFNSTASRRNLLTELDDLFSSESDFIVFYFAGHGCATDLGTFLMSVDTDRIDIGVNLDHLSNLIRVKSRDAVVLIVLDCCHSGTASARSTGLAFARNITNTDIEKSAILLGGGKVILAACKPNELAYEQPSLQHGVFTYYILEGMQGGAADHEGEVTVHNLYDFVSQKFSNNTGQTPVFKGDVIGRIILGKNLTPIDRVQPPEHEIKKIEAQAQELINEYIQITATDIDTWKTQRYRDACAKLQPTLSWLDKQVDKYPQIGSRSKFKEVFSTAQSKLADLARLQEGYNTREGIVEKKLGSGTFGSVWQMKADDGRAYAYKVYHPIDLDNLQKLSRFNRGYRAMEQLDHTHIVQVHKFTHCPVGFTMDYIAGPNLRDFAAVRRDPKEIVIQLLTVGETLKHTHSRDVIHRDVKPENIIIKWEQDADIHRPYLTDFDLAWFSTATQYTRAGEGFGSLIYAAPEQLNKPNSQQAHAKTTDIYAFGQLCFFFVTRRDPVPNLSDNSHAFGEELRGWLFEKPARMLSKLYEDCTQIDPGKRVADFREVCDRLFEISALINEKDHSKSISFESFARQLSFSISGLSPDKITSDTTFLTTSGRTLIEIINSQPKNIVFRIESLVPLTVEGANNFKEARDMLNQRIDSVLNNYPTASRSAGAQGIFETFIKVKKVSLNIDGVETCRPLLMRIIDGIERS